MINDTAGISGRCQTQTSISEPASKNTCKATMYG